MSQCKIVIVTDSSAYVPEAALERLDVAVIPLWLLWGEERFQDGVDIDPPAFYRRLRESKTLPTSSQPSPGEFVDFFDKVAAGGNDIVAVLVSAKISGTIASAEAAQAKVPHLNIRIVDSYSSAMGLGLSVLAAARAAAAGQSVEQVVAAAEDMRERVNFLFLVDTLEYLHRGGRIGGAKRWLGTVLRVKPLLQFLDGQIEPLAQARTQSKGIAQLLDIVEERLKGRPMAEAALVDVDAVETRDRIAEMLVERFGVPVVHRSPVSPVVGTHVGPGAVGVAFYAQAG